MTEKLMTEIWGRIKKIMKEGSVGHAKFLTREYTLQLCVYTHGSAIAIIALLPIAGCTNCMQVFFSALNVHNESEVTKEWKRVFSRNCATASGGSYVWFATEISLPTVAVSNIYSYLCIIVHLTIYQDKVEK